MIPTECPVSRAFTSYISLLKNNISISNIKESTSYFPNNEFLKINNDNYLEIRANGLTPDLTPDGENKVPLFPDLSTKVTSHSLGLHSPTLDSAWGV